MEKIYLCDITKVLNVTMKEIFGNVDSSGVVRGLLCL